MSETIGYILEFTGLVLLVLGYRKSNRNLMLAAALCLWFGGGISDFVRGFLHGVGV
ncbi:hypothetical protein [Massilia sp. 9I]|uniref:hypothetical protein n=1 Tax=Massilia sp. 9I TaxID=2653152 RepID=UPI0012F0AC34|nr:hypothetical protein [Massilia sp. 9I]VXA99630.1 hypothetical protein MASSI9I_10225 [Massilia sp. 9I]